MDRIYSAEQIQVPPALPAILKAFTKEVIRLNPSDIPQFGAGYFAALKEDNLEDFLKQQGEAASAPAAQNKKRREMKTISMSSRPAHAETKLSARSKSSLVVICGPSAVGKGTILGILKKKYPGMFGVAVSHTTRAPREGEVNGTHYHFVDKKTFASMRDNGEFLEYADVHGKFYGTSKAAVNKVSESVGFCILEIDVQGAQNIKKRGNKARYLFITTSGGLEELEKRLRGRGTESEDKIQKRLKTSKRELEFLKAEPGFFDHVLVNDNLEKAEVELRDTFTKWFQNVEKYVKSAL
mmetsp:Transcript_20049/g.40476  ORF Transcript_20049/g.40476 Transcript_20049/m.40476 type:complete len:296 (-) Transcript_20049:419-1306(-)|eukprot:CAMPEP_0167811154 /NCGR_PEP_ID=MMETSP0112_2-20121227/507_1 /TAXON_ID=91324 /ORGANISM="Lotharella globosa, Strain CCCM811" /LENGTH=295 /DNA_ID=CAMNT_0007709827 /DNA_START=111 /DNA_END=998 /DNA_ORIENTATION=-